MDTRSLLEKLPNVAGRYQIGDDAVLELLEPKTRFEHDQIEAVYPDRGLLESGFGGGPVFCFSVANATCEIETGAIFDREGRLIREAFGTHALMDRYIATGKDVSQTASSVAGNVIPLANLRQENYCRWWFDSMSKPSLIKSFANLDLAETSVYAPHAKNGFQAQAFDILSSSMPVRSSSYYIKGTISSSSGITYNGGQSIGSLVVNVARDFSNLFDLRRPPIPDNMSRIYVSRSKARMRRVVDEEKIIERLTKLEIVCIDLDALSLLDQYSLFRNAELIISPHGAGLTNLLWAKPATKIVEIFPEGGVHGSAFLRLSRHLKLRYSAFVGPAAGNRDRKGNPNNADIVVDPDLFVDFIRERVLS